MRSAIVEVITPGSRFQTRIGLGEELRLMQVLIHAACRCNSRIDPSAALLLSSARTVIDQRSLDVFIVSSLQWIMNLL